MTSDKLNYVIFYTVFSFYQTIMYVVNNIEGHVINNLNFINDMSKLVDQSVNIEAIDNHKI